MSLKRKLPQKLPEGKKRMAHRPKPTHYDCPEGHAHIETITGRSKIHVLLDSGSNIFLINQKLVTKLQIPYETRQQALPILTFEETETHSGGKHFTHPILLEIGQNTH